MLYIERKRLLGIKQLIYGKAIMFVKNMRFYIFKDQKWLLGCRGIDAICYLSVSLYYSLVVT